MKIKNILGIAFLILLAAGAQPAIGAFWQWSKTATNNATADPSINWSEGMSPSSVNDSARAMMAREAEQRDDMSGLLLTSGTASAYTVTTNQGMQTPTPVNGQTIAITVNATNAAGVTLSVDSGNPYPIQSSAGQGVPVGTLVAGSPYTMKFSTSTNAWMLHNFFAQTLAVPLGALIPTTLAAVPNSNFVIANGQCISTTTYSGYWAALGSPAPGICSAGLFQIIDMRGYVPAGLDTMPGASAAGRLTSAATGCGTAMTSVGAVCANGSQSHTLVTLEMPSHTHGYTEPNGGTGHNHPNSSFPSSGVTANTTQIASAGLGYISDSSKSLGTTNAPTGISINNTGGGGAHAIVQPTIGVVYLLRVL
jgi:hypothetical protein